MRFDVATFDNDMAFLEVYQGHAKVEFGSVSDCSDDR